MKINDTLARTCGRVTASLACVGLCVATPLMAAQEQPTTVAPTAVQPAAVASDGKPAPKCMNDLRAFDARLKKDGYWLHTSGYGYGYPMFGFGYPYGGYMHVGGRLEASGYGRARPGYDVRTLIAAANILALRGQQQACETLLSATHVVYEDYLTGLRSSKVEKADEPGWLSHLIAGAVPVSDQTASLRSDDLIALDVVNEHNDNLGRVEDVLLSPKTGQIAYLVIGRGGVFGIDEKYVPIPWSAFKVTTGSLLLVLDASKANMDSAPQMNEKLFAADVKFGPDNERADHYWKTLGSP